ncbi:LysR family transcriptional regulator [Paraburkholderia sp. DHOC27]|uniref:LysR family transcriptional regulator n=1 Tax=Paraburkholderia sp. DHOC27 TaxID=2303330 RepID=UPI000E3E4338|nr:LysR family transcriptional regulator [Paraburkholderia sp. DHOC27]RFU49916.1 LysR family transcriptional regulator [Paraburkholderia sp. DHOC27]
MSDLRNLTFDHLLNYIAVVETGSFTRAAERRGIGKTTVSDSIQRLELELGATLLVRTTRRINVTEAGASFFETCREIVRLAEEAMSVVSPSQDDLRGTLRVASSVEYSAIVLAPVLARMRSAHPGLRIDMVSADRLIDLIAEGVDVAIRLGELTDSSHRAVRIGEYSKWLVASPGFVARQPLPDDISEAAKLGFVGLSVLAQPSRFTLHHADGASQDIEFVAGLLADTVYGCRAAIAEGVGIGVLPDFSVRADVAAGRLVRVYADWSTAPVIIHALLPPGRHTAPKVRALIDMLKARRDEDVV